MKMDEIYFIEWHEKNLENMKRYLGTETLAWTQLGERIEKLKKGIKLLEFQINEAKKEGKSNFHPEKYKIKKR